MAVSAKLALHGELDNSQRIFQDVDSLTLDQPGDISLALSPDEVTRYIRSGDDLVLELASGETFTIVGFFQFDEVIHLYFQDDDFQGEIWRASFAPDLPQGALTVAVPERGTTDEDDYTAGSWGSSGVLLGLLGAGVVAAAAGGGGGGGGDDGVGSGGGNEDPPPDTTAPDAPVINPTNGREVSGTAEPGSSITVIVDGDVVGETDADANGDWSVDVEPDLEDGDIVRVTATDDAGNESPETIREVDAEGPAVSLDEILTNDATPALSGTVDDPDAVVTVTVNGTDYTAINNGDGTWSLPDNTLPTLPEGAVDVVVTATDPLGNEGSASGQIVVDTIAPDAPTIEPTDGSVITGTAEPGTDVVLSIDGSEIATVPVGNGGNWSYDPEPDLADGTEISAVAVDDAGNVSDPDTEIVDASFEDTTPPPPPDFNPTDGTGVSGTAEPGSTVELTVDGEVVGTTTAGPDGSWSVDLEPDLEDGDVIAGTATDASGNESGPASVTVDGVTPVITFDNLITNDATPALSGTVDDSAADVVITVNGVDYAASNNGDGTWTLADNSLPALPEGSTNATATATDVSGYSSSDSASITVDLTSPLVTLDDLNTNDATPALSGSVDEPNAAIVVTVDGIEYAATNHGDGTWTLADDALAALPEGDTTATVTATDAAGNSGSDSATISVDLTAPVVTVDGLTTSDPTPELTGTVDDPTATVVVTVNGVDYPATNNGDGTWTLPNGDVAALVEGDTPVTVTATDAVGNTGSGSGSVTVDLTGITVTIEPQTTNDATPEITGTVDDPSATVSVSVAGVDYVATNNGDGTWTLADDTVAALAEGGNTAMVTATDGGGDTATDSATITVDLTAPAVTVDPVVSNDTTPALTGSVDDSTASVVVTVGGVDYPATNNGDGSWTLADNTLSPLVEGDSPVTVTATDAAGNSGTDSATITIDLTGPSVTIEPLMTSDSTPALSGTVDDPTATVVVTVDGTDYAATNNGDGTWTLADNTLLNLAEGTTTATVTATDAAANSDTDSAGITVDMTAPAVSVDDVMTDDDTPALSGTVNDPAADIVVTVGGTDYPATNNGDGTWTLADDTLPSLAEGDHPVTVTATDPLGNSGSDNATITVDQTAPAVTIDPLNTSDATPELTGTVDDPTATVVVTVDGSDYPATNNGDGTWTLADNTLPALGEGDYSVEVTATDTDGNFDTDSDTLTIDLTAPVVSIDDLTTNDATPEITGTVDDPNASVVVTIDGTDYPATNNGDGSWTLANGTVDPLPEGENPVTVTATDPQGNQGTDTGTVDVDLTGLTVTIDGLTTNDTTPELTGTVDDPAATITVTIDGADYPATNNGDGSWTLAEDTVAALAEGDTTATVTASDGGGNTDSDSATITIDLTAPVITIDDLVTNDTTPELTGAVDDPAASVVVTVGGVDYPATNNGDGTWTLADNTLAALAEGDTSATVTATDGGGNTDTDTATISVDLTAPAAPTIDYAEDNVGDITDDINDGDSTDDTTPTLVGTAEAGSTVTIFQGAAQVGTTTADGAGAWSFTSAALADGDYTFSATATDTAGNQGPASADFDLTVDTAAPAAPVITLAEDNVGADTNDLADGDTTDDTTPTLVGTADAGSTVIISRDGVEVGSTTADGSGNWSFESAILNDGSYSWTATAQDEVGNESGTSNQFDLVVSTPNSPPVAQVTDTSLLGLVGADALGLVDLSNQDLFAFDIDGNLERVTITYEALASVTLDNLLGGQPTLTASSAMAAELGLSISIVNDPGVLGVLFASSTLTIEASDGGTIDNLIINELLGTVRFEQDLGVLDSLLRATLLENTQITAEDSLGESDTANASDLADADALNSLDGGSDDIQEGDSGNNNIVGTTGTDRLYGYAGNDTIDGDAGNDLIRGGAGDDSITGGDGSDVIFGGGGADDISGGAGSDLMVVPDAGFAAVDGGSGDDILRLSSAGINLDFAGDASLRSRVDNIEALDIGGTGANSVSLDEAAINAITDGNNFIRVDGDSDDTASFDLDNATLTGAQTFQGTEYHTYDLGSATLWVDMDVAVVDV